VAHGTPDSDRGGTGGKPILRGELFHDTRTKPREWTAEGLVDLLQEIKNRRNYTGSTGDIDVDQITGPSYSVIVSLHLPDVSLVRASIETLYLQCIRSDVTLIVAIGQNLSSFYCFRHLRARRIESMNIGWQRY
jgi:hypothetical protein